MLALRGLWKVRPDFLVRFGTVDDASDTHVLGKSIADYYISTTNQDHGVAGNRLQETDTAHRGTNTDEDTANTGVVALTQWFERMETVFYLSNCSVENQIKFATCTLLGSALTLWNSHVKTVGHDVAYAITWINLKKKMNDNIDPKGDVKNMRVKVNLKLTGSGKKKPYRGSKPLCSKCNYHHDGQCASKYHKCNRVGHLAHDCRSTTMPILLTTKGALGQVRNLHALSVEPSDISRGSV
ncbi:hypothetical protein Tco_1048943 [Tanacetum coccineum]